MATERLFSQDRTDVDTGALIEVVNTSEFYTKGSNKFNELRPARFEIAVYENCMRMMIECDGIKRYHYAYHEDIFHPINYKQGSRQMIELQQWVLNIWKNPNYNGYITSQGIKTRAELLKQGNIVSKL